MDGLQMRIAEALREADVAGLFREEDIRRMARAVTKESNLSYISRYVMHVQGAGARKRCSTSAHVVPPSWVSAAFEVLSTCLAGTATAPARSRTSTCGETSWGRQTWAEALS